MDAYGTRGMAEPTSVGPSDSYASLTFDPAETELLENTEYHNLTSATSPDGTYTLCGVEECSAVVLFTNDELVYEKALVGPYELAVANTGTAVVSGFKEGGYGDGDHLLSVWDATGAELIVEELRATADSVFINQTGQYAAVYTEQILENHGENEPWDFSVYIVDIEAGTIRSRYTEQIPGVQAPGPRRKQIETLQFVSGNSEPYIALFEQRDPTFNSDALPERGENGTISVGDLAEVTEGPFKGDTVRVDQIRGDEEPVTVLVDYNSARPMEMDVREDQLRQLAEEETAEVPVEKALLEMTIDDIPDSVILIDLNGNIIQKGRPDMDAYPDHYQLTADAKKRLDYDDSEDDTDEDLATEPQNANLHRPADRKSIHSPIETIAAWDSPPVGNNVLSAIDELRDQPSLPSTLSDSPDITQQLILIALAAPGRDNNAAKLFEDWITAYPDPALTAEDVELILEELTKTAERVSELTTQYNDLPVTSPQDPDFEEFPEDFIEISEQKDELYSDLETEYYKAIAIGEIIAACVPHHPSIVVPYTGECLTYLMTWEQEADPDLYDGPPGNAGLRKASNDILPALAARNPDGFVKALYNHRATLYDLFPAPTHSETETPGNESKGIHSTVFRLIVPLAAEHPEAMEPILPGLVDNLGHPTVFRALEYVAQKTPELVFDATESLLHAIDRGRDFEPATGEVDYPARVAELVQSAGEQAPDEFWACIDDWAGADNQPPQVTRAILELVLSYVQTGGSLSADWSTLTQFVDHPDWQTRLVVVNILAEIEAPKAEKTLSTLAKDSIPEVSDAAEQALSERD